MDEAHQQPGLMQTVNAFPAMAKYCVTGTPYSDKVWESVGGAGLTSSDRCPFPSLN